MLLQTLLVRVVALLMLLLFAWLRLLLPLLLSM